MPHPHHRPRAQAQPEPLPAAPPVKDAGQTQQSEDDAAMQRAFLKPVYRNVDDYLAAYPHTNPKQANYLRECAPCIFIPILHDNRWSGWPGGYYMVKVRGAEGYGWWVGIYDEDDNGVVKECVSEQQAWKVLNQLGEYGPVDPADLTEVWGFECA